MDKFFDRLGDLLRSVLDQRGSYENRHDPDFQEAWNELDEYLKTGTNYRPREKTRDRTRASYSGMDEHLSQDYANLELSPGAPFGEVKKSYRNLLRKYHPDRFAMDPEKQKLATEITQKINVSFQRIEKAQKD